MKTLSQKQMQTALETLGFGYAIAQCSGYQRIELTRTGSAAVVGTTDSSKCSIGEARANAVLLAQGLNRKAR